MPRIRRWPEQTGFNDSKQLVTLAPADGPKEGFN
jgi:hypothetical protein